MYYLIAFYQRIVDLIPSYELSKAPSIIQKNIGYWL